METKVQTVKDLRDIIEGFGVKTYSGYNDKRKTFTRRIKVITKFPLSKGQFRQLQMLTGACEVGYTKSIFYGGVYVKIQ